MIARCLTQGPPARKRCASLPSPILMHTRLTLVAAALVSGGLLFPPTVLSAQPTVHPRDMVFDTPAFTRPDPQTIAQQIGAVRAYIVQDRRVPLVTVSAFVRVGYGDSPTPGVAQAVERALRNGPSAMAGGAFAEEVRRMVGEWRVTMGPEQTELSLDVPASDAKRAIELVVSTLRAPGFVDVSASTRPSQLRSTAASGESGPVLYEGSLPLAVELLTEWELGEHPYGGLATAAVSAQAARDFHRTWFSASQVVLAVAGDVAVGEARAAIETAVSGWDAGRAPSRARVARATTRPAERQIRMYNTNKLQGWVVLGHSMPSVPIGDRAALDVMNYIFGGGHVDTRLFRAVRDTRGLSNDASAFPVYSERGPGMYTIRTYGRPDVVPLLAELSIAEAERIRTDSVTDDEITIAKGALADGSFAIRYKDGYSTAHTLAEEWARTGSHDESATYQRRVSAVTKAQVTAAAQRYLHPSRFRIVILGPLEDIAKANHPESSNTLDMLGRVLTSSP